MGNRKNTGDGSSVTVMIPLPPELCSQFPGGIDGNGGQPHVTFLYLGDLREECSCGLIPAIKKIVQKRILRSISGRLGSLDYFYNPHGNKQVAHVDVRFSEDMGALRDLIKDDIQEIGFNLRFDHPVFHPHVTLEYIDGVHRENPYHGFMPKGDWTFDSMEVWGLPRVETIKFNPSCRGLSRTAERSEGEKEDAEVDTVTPSGSPKIKPPRRDRAKSRMNVSDPDMGSDLKGTKDLTLDRRKVGGFSRSFAYSERQLTGRGGTASPFRDHRSKKEKGMPAKTIKQASVTQGSALKRASRLIEKNAKAFNIPSDVVKDFTNRCALLIEHTEKTADFDPSTIGETKSGPLLQDADESWMDDEFTQEENFGMYEEFSAGSKYASVPFTKKACVEMLGSDTREAKSLISVTKKANLKPKEGLGYISFLLNGGKPRKTASGYSCEIPGRKARIEFKGNKLSIVKTR